MWVFSRDDGWKTIRKIISIFLQNGTQIQEQCFLDLIWLISDVRDIVKRLKVKSNIALFQSNYLKCICKSEQ